MIRESPDIDNLIIPYLRSPFLISQNHLLNLLTRIATNAQAQASTHTQRQASIFPFFLIMPPIE